MASTKNVALRRCDSDYAAMKSRTIKHVIGDHCADNDCREKLVKLPSRSAEDRVASSEEDLQESNVMGRSSHDNGKFSLVHTSKGEGHVNGTNDAPPLHRVCNWPILRAIIICALFLVLMLLLPKYVSARVSSTTLPGAPIQHNNPEPAYKSFNHNITNSPSLPGAPIQHNNHKPAYKSFNHNITNSP